MDVHISSYRQINKCRHVCTSPFTIGIAHREVVACNDNLLVARTAQTRRLRLLDCGKTFSKVMHHVMHHVIPLIFRTLPLLLNEVLPSAATLARRGRFYAVSGGHIGRFSCPSSSHRNWIRCCSLDLFDTRSNTTCWKAKAHPRSRVRGNMC